MMIRNMNVMIEWSKDRNIGNPRDISEMKHNTAPIKQHHEELSNATHYRSFKANICALQDILNIGVGREIRGTANQQRRRIQRLHLRVQVTSWCSRAEISNDETC